MRARAKPDPVERPRRFYKAVDLEPREGGFAVRLDGRVAKTPGGAPLLLPTQALARLIADEWDAQGEFIVMPAMPATRLAFTTVDRVPTAREPTADEAARYAGSDLLCYFAEAPAALLERQTAAWEPILAWAESELGLTFNRAAGVIHCAQPPETLARAGEMAARLDDFTLAGLAFAAPLLGSFVLAAAVMHERLGGEEAFQISRIDETFQEEAWGVDAEAAARAERLLAEAVMVDRWFEALRG
jgi:chaperone required for assembly of F1-ATPase